jgi:hypothetical protein
MKTINLGINERKTVVCINGQGNFHEYRGQDNEHCDILHILSRSPTYCLIFYLALLLLYFLNFLLDICNCYNI